MVIRASASKAIDALVADLSSENAVTRDAAGARLIVIGPRAVTRLVTLASDRAAAASARVAAFRSLEAIADPRILPCAISASADAEPVVAAAALRAIRPFLRTPKGVQALDRVTEAALDPKQPTAVRIAAIESLRELPAATVKPVFARLAADADAEIAGALQPQDRRTGLDAVRRLEEAAAGNLPAPDLLKRAIAQAGTEMAADTLRGVIERVRIREGSEPPGTRAGWIAARAAAHLALARRGSRVALYDLRETVSGLADRLPVEFFAAMTRLGDATCLEPLCAAYARTSDEWSRRELAGAFRAIVEREKLTRRHAVARKIEKRWPGLWPRLASPGFGSDRL